VIAGNRVFLQSASAEGKDRSLICLDATNGKVLWTRTTTGSPAKTHVRNTLASSTPAVEGDSVFVVFWDGKNVSLHAHSVQGELIWKQDLGSHTSQHGPGFSPVVHDGKVFVVNDQDGSSVVLAFDARKGEKIWKAERKAFRACYATPLVNVKPDGTTELIVATTAGITGYDPTTGLENWDYTWSFSGMALRAVASPIIASGLVIANSGAGEGGRHVIAVRLGGKGDVTKTHLAWENRKSFPYVPSLVASGDHLYSVTDEGFAACHVAKTGEVVWRKRIGSPVTASPILVDGKVYVIGEDGEVYVFEAATTYKLLAKNSMGEPVMSSPAVSNSRLYIRGKDHLFCIGKSPAK